MFGKKLIKTVAGDAAGNIGIALADQIRVSITQGAKARVNFCETATGADDLLEFSISGWAYLHALAVIGKDVEFQNVIDGAAGHHGVNAAGVVADHAAEVAIFVGGRIRAKGEVMLVGAITKLIKHEAGLYPRIFFRRIKLGDLVEVFREINDDGGVAALSGKAGAASATQQRSAVLARDGDGLNHFFNGLWNHHADGNLAIV